MRIFRRKILYEEIETYIRHRAKTVPTAVFDRYDLIQFAKYCPKDSVKDIAIDDLRNYIGHLRNTRGSQFSIIGTCKILRCFIRYYYQRRVIHIPPNVIGQNEIDTLGEKLYNYNMENKRKPGPEPDYKRDKMVYALRAQGFSFRDIASQLDENVKTSFTRYKRHLKSVGELSTH